MVWMLILAAIFLTVMLVFGLPTLWDHIATGLFYSATILLINEIAQYFRDKRTLGILEGDYERIQQFETIEDGVRAERLPEERKEQLRRSGKEPVNGTNYTEFNYGVGPSWTIRLRYHHSGLYTGIAKYPKYWGNRKEATDAQITLKVDDGINAGSGTYSYSEMNDYGIYSFQIREQDLNKIIVTYQNVVPSGIAAGYEVWQKMSPRSR